MELKGKRLEVDIRHDIKIDAWFGKSPPVSKAEMAARVFRFGQMPQTDRAFIDAVMPGHNRILMGALGRGTADENLKPQVEQAENYHIDYIKAEPGNGAALHSHDTEETFICLTGTWRIGWGDHGENHIDIDYLDGVVCPPGVMREFKNTSATTALLIAIIGGKEPGNVVWAESIHAKMAAAYK